MRPPSGSETLADAKKREPRRRQRVPKFVEFEAIITTPAAFAAQQEESLNFSSPLRTTAAYMTNMDANTAAREAARDDVNGQFGTHDRSAPEAELPTAQLTAGNHALDGLLDAASAARAAVVEGTLDLIRESAPIGAARAMLSWDEEYNFPYLIDYVDADDQRVALGAPIWDELQSLVARGFAHWDQLEQFEANQRVRSVDPDAGWGNEFYLEV